MPLDATGYAPQVDNPVVTMLKRGLARIENEENWCRSNFYQITKDGCEQHCAMGAIAPWAVGTLSFSKMDDEDLAGMRVGWIEGTGRAIAALTQAAQAYGFNDIVHLNDSLRSNHALVVRAFRDAIEIARNDG